VGIDKQYAVRGTPSNEGTPCKLQQKKTPRKPGNAGHSTRKKADQKRRLGTTSEKANETDSRKKTIKKKPEEERR